MTKFDSARALFERLLETITVLLIISLAVVVVLGVIFRWAGESLSWYDEIASVQLAWEELAVQRSKAAAGSGRNH